MYYNIFSLFPISECISYIDNDLSLNSSLTRSSKSWKSHNNLTQYPSHEKTDSLSERHRLALIHRQSLRQQLAKVKHLRDEYDTHVRLRDALTRMMRITKSRDCDTEWRENGRNLIGIEKQLELMLGSYQ